MLPPKKVALMVIACALSSGLALAKLPPPSEEAKAKAVEAKAKAAHAGNVAAFQLCNSMDKVAQRYLKDNKAKAGKPVETPKCQDPGPFQMVSVAPAAPAAAPATAPAPAPAKK